MGSGKMIVEFFSAEMEFSVCKIREDRVRVVWWVDQANPLNGSPDNVSIWLMVQVLASPIL